MHQWLWLQVLYQLCQTHFYLKDSKYNPLTFQLLEGLYSQYMNGQLTIGQIAREVGIPAKTIRYYEEINLLKPVKRADNRYRLYSNEDVIRLSLIKQGRALGLPLDQVKGLVEEGLDGTCEDLKESIIMKLPNYIESVKERITELQQFQQEMETLQKNLTALHLNKPKEKVTQKDCCEVLEKIEQTLKGGGEENVS